MPADRVSAGARAALPIVLGYIPIGFACGVVARGAGLSPMEAGLMSLLVYGGTSQFIASGMLAAGAAAPAIVLTTFFVNLRHLLFTTALVPSLQHLGPLTGSLLAYSVTDESFAVAAAELRGRPAGARFMAGLQYVPFACWGLASVAGAVLGDLLGDTRRLGLDFALPAMFIGLLLPQLQGAEWRARWVSAALAALLSVGVALVWPGSLSIVLATVLAAAVGVLIRP